jgi:uncharacterized protein (DUF1778 family)
MSIDDDWERHATQDDDFYIIPSESQLLLLQEAAALRGHEVATFILASAIEKAKLVIKEYDNLGAV